MTQVWTRARGVLMPSAEMEHRGEWTWGESWPGVGAGGAAVGGCALVCTGVPPGPEIGRVRLGVGTWQPRHRSLRVWTGVLGPGHFRSGSGSGSGQQRAGAGAAGDRSGVPSVESWKPASSTFRGEGRRGVLGCVLPKVHVYLDPHSVTLVIGSSQV